MKLNAFKKNVLQKVESEIAAVKIEMEAVYNFTVEAATQAVSVQELERLSAERYSVMLIKNKETAAFFNQTKRTYHERRNQLTDTLFNDVLQTLHNYIQSPSYQSFLLYKLSQQNTEDFSFIQVMARDKDLITVPANLTLETTQDDFLGGFKLLTANRKTIADYTLLTYFNEQRTNFPMLYAEALRK